MLSLALLGLVAAALVPSAVGSPIVEPIVEPRQEAACSVTVKSCDGKPMVLDLTECACACLQNSCDLVGGCDNTEGTPFKGDALGGAFNKCVEDSPCIPVFAAGQALDPALINCRH